MRTAAFLAFVVSFSAVGAMGQGWVIDETPDPMTDFQDVSSYVLADTPVSVRHGAVVPSLHIGCRDNQTRVFVHWADDVTTGGADGYTLVRYRLDDNRPVDDRWDLSTSHEATGLWGMGSLPLLRDMYRGDTGRVLVSTTPNGENPVLAEFNTTGIREVVEVVAERCNWFLPPPDQTQAVFLEGAHHWDVSTSFADCWRPDAGLLTEQVFASMTVRLQMSADGSVNDAEVVHTRGPLEPSVFEELERTTVQAILDPGCHPLPEGYQQTWQDADYYVEIFTQDLY